MMEQNPVFDPSAIPPSLLAQVQPAAEEDHRPTRDLLCEALERYLRERQWQKVFAYGEQRARELGLTEDDIPRLIAESRQERAKAGQ